MPTPFERLSAAMSLEKGLEELIAIYNSGVKLDDYSQDGATAYHIVIELSRYDFIQYLLDVHKLDVDQRTKKGLTPIQYIVDKKLSFAYDKIRYFVERGAKIEAINKIGQTALHMACQSGEKKAVEKLLECGADLNATTLVSAKEGNNGEVELSGSLSPLHLAVVKNPPNLELTQLLLDRGADTRATTVDGYTPLHLACCKKEIDSARLLISKRTNINAATPDGYTPLHFVAQNNHITLVFLLLQAGADINAKTKQGGTALDAVIEDPEHLEVAKLLVNQGSKFLTNACISEIGENETTLGIIAYKGMPELMEYIRKEAMNHEQLLQYKCLNGFSLIYLAALGNNVRMLDYLLSIGFDINTARRMDSDNSGDRRDLELCQQGVIDVTPLRYAAAQAKPTTVEFLIKRGAKIGDLETTIAWAGRNPDYSDEITSIINQAAIKEKGAYRANHNGTNESSNSSPSGSPTNSDKENARRVPTQQVGTMHYSPVRSTNLDMRLPIIAPSKVPSVSDNNRDERKNGCMVM